MTTNHTDLISRLRERRMLIVSASGRVTTSATPDTDCTEAADALEAMQAEQPSVREPLTDARIVDLAESCGYDGAVPTVRLAFHGFKLWEFARTVEAAHGIGVKGEA